jgi:hypothetical protein
MLTVSSAGGDWWTDNYALRPIGVLECPTVEIFDMPRIQECLETTKREEDDWILVNNES